MEFYEPAPEQYLKLEENQSARITIRERLADHDEFKLGGKKGKPAPVYRVECEDDTTKRFTVTSTQLWNTLCAVEKKLGSFMGIEMVVTPLGKDKDRTYRIRISDDAAANVQQQIKA